MEKLFKNNATIFKEYDISLDKIDLKLEESEESEES